MEAFLAEVLPKIIANRATFLIHVHRGKDDLLRKFTDRLRGYKRWIPENFKIVVIVDRDDDDCLALKAKMEAGAISANLVSRSQNGNCWQVLNRIAVEELEAWFFGEWSAVRSAYEGVPDIVGKQSYRNCDDIRGGTWEALERELQKRGYFKEGLRKVEAAFEIASKFDPEKCESPSFRCFKNALTEAL